MVRAVTVEEGLFDTSCCGPPIGLIDTALAKVALAAEHLKVVRIQGEVRKFGPRLDMIHLKRITQRPPLSAALAMVALGDECFVSQRNPLVGQKEEPGCLSEGRRGHVGIVEC